MPEISSIKVPSGTVYTLKDTVARSAISGGMQFIGLTTTALTDECTTNPIVIDGTGEVTAVSGNVTVSKTGKDEFIFDGTKWRLLGSQSDLGDLAYKDNATGSFTPAGAVAVTPTTVSATTITTPCVLPVFSTAYTSANEQLELTWSAGTALETTTQAVMTGATASFTGTAGQVVVS